MKVYYDRDIHNNISIMVYVEDSLVHESYCVDNRTTYTPDVALNYTLREDFIIMPNMEELI